MASWLNFNCRSAFESTVCAEWLAHYLCNLTPKSLSMLFENPRSTHERTLACERHFPPNLVHGRMLCSIHDFALFIIWYLTSRRVNLGSYLINVRWLGRGCLVDFFRGGQISGRTRSVWHGLYGYTNTCTPMYTGARAYQWGIRIPCGVYMITLAHNGGRIR